MRLFLEYYLAQPTSRIGTVDSETRWQSVDATRVTVVTLRIIQPAAALEQYVEKLVINNRDVTAILQQRGASRRVGNLCAYLLVTKTYICTIVSVTLVHTV